MDSTARLSAYLPADRRYALADGSELPDPAQGAALFADISGFTPLTEALVNELGPKRGAEELSLQLNRVYDALIANVDRYRGSVIIFSGDAITCWFDGDDGRRALACGLDMQTAMQAFAAVQTPGGGQVALAMKAAVAVGSARRFRVGRPERQLMDALAGATLDRMAAGEKHANRGEVIIDEISRPALSGLLTIREERDGFAVVSGLTVPVAAEGWPPLPAELTAADLRPWILGPMFERIQNTPDQYLAEIRAAVTLFLSFGGLDYDHDPQAGQKLDAYLGWAQDVLERYGGYLLQVTIGDKGSYFYASFGAPVAYDDAADRAVAAALALRAPPPELNFIRDTHQGISQGRLWAGAYGGGTRHTYGVLGDVVNLAARLMGKAGPGEVLVSQPVADAVRDSYALESIGLVQLKGKKDPLPAWRVLERQAAGQAQVTRTYAAPLVGREAELGRLEALLERTLAGQGQVVRLEGAAGLGKSHLTAAFSERARGRGARVASGACQSISQDAYAPWRQAFRALLGLTEVPASEQIAQVENSVRQAQPEWLIRLPLLGDLLDLSIPDTPTTAALDRRLRQEALFTLAVELAAHWANQQPLLLVMEDAHWMDEASLGLTTALARGLAQTPVLLLLVTRPPVREDRPILPEVNRLPHHTLLALDELNAQGVGALVANRLRGPAAPLALDLILARAQGNPFFTEELVDALRESGRLVQRADQAWTLSDELRETLRQANALTRESSDAEWQLSASAQLSSINLGLPDSVQGVVLTRIDRLPEANKLTLKVASVIGRLFDIDLLAQAHPDRPDPDALLRQIETLETRDFTRLESPPPRRTYLFKHNITLEVVYDTLLAAQQRELHLAVGQALERLQPEAVEQLAHHYSRSGERGKTVFYLDQAARKTQDEYANETALNYYAQALGLEERWTWRQGQAEVLHILGRREEQRDALQALSDSEEAPRLRVAYLWAQYHEAVGDYAQARAAVERGLAAARDQNDRLAQARCETQLGLIARRQGDYDNALLWYSTALEELREAHSLEGMRALSDALNGLGMVYRQQGAFEEARRCFEQGLALSREQSDRAGEAQALSNLGGTAFYQRQISEAAHYHQQALDTRRSLGDRAGEGTSLYSLAQTSLDSGDYAQAERYYTGALAIQQAVGNRWEESNVWNGLGVLYQELGDWPKAQRCLRESLRLSQEIGDEAGQTYTLANLGLVVRDQGDLPAAEKLLTDGLTLARKQADKYTESYFLSHLAIVHLRQGRTAAAMELAERALEARRELDLRLWTTADLTTLAAGCLALGQTEAALTRAREALAILDECQGQGPEFPQQDYFTCYQVLSATGQTQAAQSALRSAQALVLSRAQKIADPGLRQSFLDQVPINRQVLAEVPAD